MHTFINHRSHSIDDVIVNQPLVRSTQVVVVIDDVILLTPEYQLQQICKDFILEHGMRLSYCHACQIKEKAKKIIYGLPQNYHKLLPWICDRVV